MKCSDITLIYNSHSIIYHLHCGITHSSDRILKKNIPVKFKRLYIVLKYVCKRTDTWFQAYQEIFIAGLCRYFRFKKHFFQCSSRVHFK